MSAQVTASQNTTGIEKVQSDAAGASYAHAVLNFKSDNSNKENINSDPMEAPVSTKTLPIQPNVANAKEVVVEETNPLAADDDSTFTPVVSHSRKERKNEKKREKAREAHRSVVNGTSEKHSEKREHASAKEPKERQPQEGDKEEQEKKVFVEAPLPTVNPWQRNRSGSVPQPPPPKEEKRVLQPQKQGTIVNGQHPPVLAKAPKDNKRKPSRKVSNHF